MLLASPLRLADAPDLDLEFVLPGVRARLRALGRVVREAPEVAWPFRGYGVEFLFVPEDSHATITLVVSGALRPAPLDLGLPDQKPRHPLHGPPRGMGLRDPRARAGRAGLGGGDPPRPARELAAGRRGPLLRGGGGFAARSRCARRASSSAGTE